MAWLDTPPIYNGFDNISTISGAHTFVLGVLYQRIFHYINLKNVSNVFRKIFKSYGE